MSRHAFNLKHCLAGVEGLIDHLALLAAIDGIGEVHRKLAEIHGFGPSEACFFVGYERDVYIAMLHSGIFLEDLQRRHNI